MGITLNDICKQYELLQRGDEIRHAQEQAAERMRLRDHFAAAALAGMLARPDIDDEPLEYHFLCEHAYKWADAMIRERERTGNRPTIDGIPIPPAPASRPAETCQQNHDAAPAAKATKCGGTPHDAAGTGNTRPSSVGGAPHAAIHGDDELPLDAGAPTKHHAASGRGHFLTDEEREAIERVAIHCADTSCIDTARTLWGLLGRVAPYSFGRET